jgi:hypothetical protein
VTNAGSHSWNLNSRHNVPSMREVKGQL